jgi:hypothetical protein
MRLYGAIQKVEPQDDGTVRVHGIASSEVMDDQGEIVRADAMRVAIPDYMRFPALREMHQLSAAGTTLEAEVGDDGLTRIVAHVVDPVAVAKVRNQVYRGFSIGGRVTQREAGNPKAITGLVLNEISLVDRPANPEAVFDCWKASAASEMPPAPAPDPFNPPVQVWACGVPEHHHRAKGEAVRCLEKRAPEAADFHPPLSAREADEAPSAAGGETVDPGGTVAAIDAAKRAIETAEGALAKTDARPNLNASADSGGHLSEVDCADPGYQPDGKRRYPIDTERHIRAAWSYINMPRNARRYTADQVKRIKATIIAAWKDKIDPEGPASAADGAKASRAALTKALWDVGHVARIILELDWLQDALEVAAAMEGEASPPPGSLREIVTELCGRLGALVTEETNEILSDPQIDDGSLSMNAPELLAIAAGARGATRIAALLRTGKPNMQKFAAGIVAKAKHSQSDQALVDMARYACDKCLKIDGLSAEETAHISKARDHLCEAGAAPSEVSAVDSMGDIDPVAPEIDPPVSDFRPGDNATVDTSKGLGVSAAPAGKRSRAHQNLMDIAHDCVSKLTGGMACSQLLPDPQSEPYPAANPSTQDVAKVGARHSSETMGHLHAAHSRLVAAGAQCDAAGADEQEQQGTEFDSVKAVPAKDLAKVLADERAEKATLVKALGEIVPLLDRLSRRVEDIARTPLPPLTIAKGSVSVSKQQDSGSLGGAGDTQLSPEAIASALAKMSKEEQTLTLIKASYANPIRVLGVAAPHPAS